MKRFVRISLAMILACFGVAALRGVLGFDDEFMGPELEGLFDIAMVAAGGLLVTLSDREYFWLTPPKRKQAKRRSRAAR